MNKNTLKAAVNKYTPLIVGKTVEEIHLMLAEDDKGYTADENNEISYALLNGVHPEKTEAPASSYIACDEWRMDFSPEGMVDGEPTKLKKIRSGVKIEEWVMNEMNLSCSNLNPSKYFPANS